MAGWLAIPVSLYCLQCVCVAGGSADDTKKEKGKSRMIIMRQTERRKKKWELCVSRRLWATREPKDHRNKRRTFQVVASLLHYLAKIK